MNADLVDVDAFEKVLGHLGAHVEDKLVRVPFQMTSKPLEFSRDQLSIKVCNLAHKASRRPILSTLAVDEGEGLESLPLQNS